MSKIICRVWDKTAKRMIFLDGVNPAHAIIFINGYAEFIDFTTGEGGDDYEIELATQTKDEDGKIIYENDVVEISDGDLIQESVVYFNDYGFYVDCELINADHDCMHLGEAEKWGSIKIIGNIRENPIKE